MEKQTGRNPSRRWGHRSLFVLVGAVIWYVVWSWLEAVDEMKHPPEPGLRALASTAGIRQWLLAAAGGLLGFIAALVFALIGLCSSGEDRWTARWAMAICLGAWIAVATWLSDVLRLSERFKPQPAPVPTVIPIDQSGRHDML
jgi:hypothetical protein